MILIEIWYPTDSLVKFDEFGDTIPEIHYNDNDNDNVPNLNISPTDETETIYIKGRIVGRLGWNSVEEFVNEIY